MKYFALIILFLMIPVAATGSDLDTNQPRHGNSSKFGSDKSNFELQKCRNILFVVDSSFQMKAKFSKSESKLSKAKSIIREVINEIPNHVNLGLRIYGMGISSNIMKDSQLLVPISSSNGEEIISKLETFESLGDEYALTWAVKQAFEKDLASSKENSVIVLINSGSKGRSLLAYIEHQKKRNFIPAKLLILNLDKRDLRKTSSIVQRSPRLAALAKKMPPNSHKCLERVSRLTNGKYYHSTQLNIFKSEISELGN